jgi:hypothetical protein
LFFKICVQQIQTSRRIAVDPAIVVIVAQSYAALPKFVLDKRVRQQIVLRGLELPWRYNRYLQTGAFSLACQLGVRCATVIPFAPYGSAIIAWTQKTLHPQLLIVSALTLPAVPT